MIALPFFAPIHDPWPLNAPGRFLLRVATCCHTPTRLFHVLGESVQNAHHQHAIRPAVQAGVNAGCHLIPAILDTRMRKHEHTAVAQRAG